MSCLKWRHLKLSISDRSLAKRQSLLRELIVCDKTTYMHQRWGELTAYLLDGALEIDNNLVENLIRPFALGRKNWLFSGSPRGAHASALFYSLIATAKANGLNPFNYLKTLFENIRSCRTAEDYIMLLPYALNPK